MAKVILVLGESGSGKTTAAETLPPKNTFFINPVGKDLPFPGADTNYKKFNINTGEGNIYSSKKPGSIAKVLKYVSENRPEIKCIVLDDNQYISLFTFIGRISEKSFDKFNDIAVQMVEMIEFLKSLRKDITIFVLQHVESGDNVQGDAQIQAKTMGKFVREKVTFEGLFTIVLLCDKEDEGDGDMFHFFWTRRANSTVKTPKGMFTEQKIPNDLYAVAKRVAEYYKAQ